MGLTDIIQGGGVKVHITKKKQKQSDVEPVNRQESVLEYLDGQIADLEKKGNLDPEYHTIGKGSRKGEKIRKITAWSAVDEEGKREILIMCKNKKMFINEDAARANRGIFIDPADDNYKNVLKYLKHLRSEIAKMDLEEFNPWTRLKKKNEIQKIV